MGKRSSTWTEPGSGDAAQVVAEEVDDHDVLGAIFFVVLEREGSGGVFGGVEAAGHGALHGAGGDFVGAWVSFDAEEEFGAEKERMDWGPRLR